MNPIERKQIEESRKQTALKHTFFNRYLLLRYSLALFFFANLYWMVIQVLQPSLYMGLPLVLLLFDILAYAEQFRMYGREQVYLNWSQRAFQLQATMNLLLVCILLFTNQFTQVFPVFAANQRALSIVCLFLALGVGIAGINLRRISMILQGKDRAYQDYQYLKKIMSL